MATALDPEPVSFEQACEMIADGDSVHTFRQGGIALIGADWTRKQLLDAIRKYGAELSGPQATSMKHGLVLIDDYGALFIATKEPSVAEPGQPETANPPVSAAAGKAEVGRSAGA